MRSKPRARKLTHGDDKDEQFNDNGKTRDLETTLVDHQRTALFPSAYVVTDIRMPPFLELRQSPPYMGLSIRTKINIPKGSKFGPFIGTSKRDGSTENGSTEHRWKNFDADDSVKGCLDASFVGDGNWMKYVRKVSSQLELKSVTPNTMAVQLDEKIYYKTVRDIEPGEEMLLYAREAVFPEPQIAESSESIHGEHPFMCTKCTEIFQSGAELRQHQAFSCHQAHVTHSNGKQHYSDLHTESDTSNQSREEMPRETAEESDIAASTQDEENSTSSKLQCDDSRNYPCENCDKLFTDPSNLQRHIRSQHVGARCHACTECGKTFATSSGLKQHQHIHSSVKPFQCEVCLKAYTQFSNLCRHKRMHADCRQQIKCKDCGQAFSTVTSLSKHKRFCEGMLRNGARFGYPTQVPPVTALPGEKSPSANPMQQATALTAAYMNFYSPRPPFPFYAPLAAAGFPLFPPGHPLAAMAPPNGHIPDMAKLLPGQNPGLPITTADLLLSSKKKEMQQGSEGSDAGTDLSDVSTGSDLDTTTGSDAESENGDKQNHLDLEDMHHDEKPVVPVTLTMKPDPTTKLRPEPKPRQDYYSKQYASDNNSNKTDIKSDVPFDLSKPVVAPPTGRTDEPLDLTVKRPSEDTPRKTHVFGQRSPPPPPQVPSPPSQPEKKLHYAYPMSSMMMDPMYRLDKEKMESYHEAARMMASYAPRFHMPTPMFPGVPGMPNPLRNDMPKNVPPMMKLGKAPDAFHFSPPGGANGKMKERYSCKFCGKIFPRSANLTRHLRTHTGEQPYKCKYCERSFSISSNLQRHVRNIHNKEKPFRCPLCDRCFGQQTNLDRHLKKHETEGPNITDSPTHDLDDKEDTYFDEIRHFIGKSTSSDIDVTSPNKDYDHIDANFSITAQIGKQQHKLNIDKTDSDSLNHMDMRGDEDEDDIDDNEATHFAKKPRYDTENDASSDLELENSGFNNGYHHNASEDEMPGLTKVKGYELNTAPLTCST